MTFRNVLKKENETGESVIILNAIESSG